MNRRRNDYPRLKLKERRPEMKHVAIFLTVSVIGLGILLPGISYSADIPALRDAKDSAERTRVQALIEGARKENKLDWTGLMIEPEQSEHIVAGFKEYYGLPQLKVSYTYTTNVQIVSVVEQLLKAGRTPPDIVWTVAWGWMADLIKRGKLMQYESPYYKEYTFSHKAGLSMPGYWVSDSYTSNPIWNVTALEKRGIKDFHPTSWLDFADPKLVPLTCFSNLATSASGIPWGIGMRKTLGEEWLVKLGKGKPALYQKAEQGETWIGSGEYPIGLTARIRNARDLEESGTKVGWVFPKEGLVLFPFALSIFADAPHPNTAKLFVDYVRSSPGGDRMAAARTGLISCRPGVRFPEKDKKYTIPLEEVKVIPMDWNKEVSIEAVKAFGEWAKKVGVGF